MGKNVHGLEYFDSLILPKMICIFSTISIRIPVKFFVVTDKLIVIIFNLLICKGLSKPFLNFFYIDIYLLLIALQLSPISPLLCPPLPNHYPPTSGLHQPIAYVHGLCILIYKEPDAVMTEQTTGRHAVHEAPLSSHNWLLSCLLWGRMAAGGNGDC